VSASKIGLEYIRVGQYHARVVFGADVRSTAEGSMSAAAEIVRDKMARWVRNWANGVYVSMDVAPRFTQADGTTEARISAVVTMEAVRACEKEQALG
jgi:hypothetical protein